MPQVPAVWPQEDPSMDASRRVRAASVLPTFDPSCLFKGHLSTKSNAFCTDSSSLRLSSLQLVKNHMAVHYNKILSAKDWEAVNNHMWPVAGGTCTGGLDNLQRSL
uniref:Spermatogenesis associated 7 n=1 Tax=Ovis aries TaxID=9940 RepID=A0AC11ENU3_SHEEP